MTVARRWRAPPHRARLLLGALPSDAPPRHGDFPARSGPERGPIRLGRVLRPGSGHQPRGQGPRGWARDGEGRRHVPGVPSRRVFRSDILKSMAPPRYIVKSGDNLWDIAHATLGHGAEWPRLWRYNNRQDVIRVTKRGIPNPDLIYPGQILLLPIVPGAPTAGGTSPTPPSRPPAPRASARPITSPPSRTAPSSPTGSGSLSRQLPSVESPISLKYRLDDIKFPPIDTPAALIEMRMTGDVLLMTQRRYPAIYVTQRREIELQVVQSAEHALGSLVGDNRIIYDEQNKNVTLRSMLVSQSHTPNVPSTAIGVQMDSRSLTPKLRFEMRYPKLEGSIGIFHYAAVDVKTVIEVTPKARPNRPGPSAQPVRQPALQPRIDWGRAAGVGLLVVGSAIVVGTLVEDFFTAGAGIADDPVSFATAAASFSRGMSLLRGASAVLPAAAASTIPISVRLMPATAQLRTAGAR